MDGGSYFFGIPWIRLCRYQSARPVAAITPAPTAAPISNFVCKSMVSEKKIF